MGNFLLFVGYDRADLEDDFYIAWTKKHRMNFIRQSLKKPIHLGLHNIEDTIAALHDNEEVLVRRGLLDPSQRFCIP